MRTLIALLMLCAAAQAQTTVLPPQPNYSQYGSYSRQLRVYRHTQRQLEADRRREYRLWREEIRRQVARDRRVQPQRTIVVRNRGCEYTYGDALESWRRRRGQR